MYMVNIGRLELKRLLWLLSLIAISLFRHAKFFLLHLAIVLCSRELGVREGCRSVPCLSHASDSLEIQRTLISVFTVMLTCPFNHRSLEKKNWSFGFLKQNQTKTKTSRFILWFLFICRDLICTLNVADFHYHISVIGFNII